MDETVKRFGSTNISFRSFITILSAELATRSPAWV